MTQLRGVEFLHWVRGGWNNSTPISPPNVCSCCCSCPCSCFEVKVENGIDLNLILKAECDDDSLLPSLRSDESPEEQKQRQPQKQQQRQKPLRVSSAVKWIEKYDA